MAATPEQIAAYLSDIRYAQSVYMDNVNRLERLGHTDLFKYRLRTYILDCYVTIMVDYFSQSEYDDNNFFTTTEVADVISRINSLCDTNYNIDL
jgi:hypothetical protein